MNKLEELLEISEFLCYSPKAMEFRLLGECKRKADCHATIYPALMTSDQSEERGVPLMWAFSWKSVTEGYI